MKRQEVLIRAYAEHPERFVKGVPTPPSLPKEVWINPSNGRAGEEVNAHKKRLPETNCPQKPDAPLTHPRLGYPSPSCVPADLDSVSPSANAINAELHPVQSPLNTRVMPQKIPGVWGLAPRETTNDQQTDTIAH